MKNKEIIIPVNFNPSNVFDVGDNALTSAYQKSKDYTDGKIKTVDNSISQIRQTATEIQTQVSNNKTNIDNLTGRVSSNETNISNVT